MMGRIGKFLLRMIFGQKAKRDFDTEEGRY